MMRASLLGVGASLLGVAMAVHSVAYEDVTVNGYICGQYQTARVYYPDASGSFPAVSFAHGYNNPGQKAYECYEELVSAVAAAGYVVVVSMSSSFPMECKKEWQDQVHSLEWLRTSSLAGRVDFGKKAGLLGHSMGGGASYHAASQVDAVQAQNIGVAVALHPQVSLFTAANPLVPMFYGTGSADRVVSPSSVKSAYDKTSGVPRAFSNIQGATHYEPQSNCEGWTGAGERRHTPFAVAMFDCHLKGTKSQCDKVYGNGVGSLCSGDIPMVECEHGDEPSFQFVEV